MTDKEVRDASSGAPKEFVRSRNQLAPYDPAKNPTGHRLTLFEAEEAYGGSVIQEAVEYGSAILSAAPGAVAKAVASRREELGVTSEQAGRILHLPVDAIEAGDRGVSIQRFEKLAVKLGLDERLLAFDVKAGADPNLGVRLKTLQAEPQRGLSPSTVLSFAEAASLVRIQNRLSQWLHLSIRWNTFGRSADYGDANSPAFKVGYELAQIARNKLGIGTEPIESMRDLVETTLGVPVLQSSLPEHIAGATISNGSDRGIILNTVGSNSSVWVRRATLAHELGHLLFDPLQQMESVRVDTYEETDLDPETDRFPDYVEQRANAFAIAFLAPSDGVKELVEPPFSEEDVERVMGTFGISVTAARYHVSNTYWRQYTVPLPKSGIQPDESWRSAEDYTLDFFRPESVPSMRRGRFAGIVAMCHKQGLISSDTAALYLDCSVDDFERYAADILTLFPIA